MNWSTLAKKFGAFYEVYLVDQRNHGKSGHHEVFNYKVMADDLAEFFEENNIDKASVLGHSMGAKTAITFALNYPGKVDKLIAVDMGIKAYPVHDEAIQTGLLSLDFDAIQSREEADKALEPFIPDLGTRKFIMQNLHWTADKKLGWRMNVRGILDSIEEIGIPMELDHPYQGEALFIKAEYSDYIEAADHSEILESFPNAVIDEISNAGHWVHADRPEEFGEAVLRFLRN